MNRTTTNDLLLVVSNPPTPLSGGKRIGFPPVFHDPVRLGMQIAFGRVRRKTAPTGVGVGNLKFYLTFLFK